MNSEFSGERPNIGAPIDVLPDAMIRQRPLMDKPAEAFDAMSLRVADQTKQIEETGYFSPETFTDLAHTIALRDALLASNRFSQNPDRRLREHEVEKQQIKIYNQRLSAAGVTTQELQGEAARISVADAYDYFLSKLESYTDFLATGQQPPNWPEARHGVGLLSTDTSVDVRTIAETLYTSISPFMDELGGPIDCGVYIQRYQDWLQRTGGLLLSRGKVALAAPLMNTARRIDEQKALQTQLALAMTELKETQGDDEYRRVFSFITGTLRRPHLQDFLQLNPQEETPLIFGSTRSMEQIGDTLFMNECFEEGELVHARLADETGIVLPFQEFRQRTLMNYKSPRELEIYDRQNGVDIEELPEDAKEAVETAWRAEELGRIQEETLPYYRRLVLKPDPIMDDSLHTLDFRDGFKRIIDRYPDDHGFVTSDTEAHVEDRVMSAKKVSDGWLVVPYDGGYMNMTTYRDVEPNFFGPGEDVANAFWIAGNPRMVFDKTLNPKYARRDKYTGQIDEARWVIMPVRYYQVETQQPEFDDEFSFSRFIRQ